MINKNGFSALVCFVVIMAVSWLYKLSEREGVWVSEGGSSISPSPSSRFYSVSAYSSASSNSTSETAKTVAIENSQPSDYPSDFATVEADKILERMKNDPAFNSYFQSQLEYEAEPYEKDWAEKMVIALDKLLRSEHIGDDIKIKNISCRSKSCQIQIEYAEHNNVQEISQYLAMNVAKGELNGLLLSYIRTTFEQNTSSAIMYMVEVQP